MQPQCADSDEIHIFGHNLCQRAAVMICKRITERLRQLTYRLFLRLVLRFGVRARAQENQKKALSKYLIIALLASWNQPREIPE